MCFVNGWLLGDEKDLLEWAYCKWGYCDFRPEALYQAITEDFYTKHLKSSQASNVVLQEECKVRNQLNVLSQNLRIVGVGSLETIWSNSPAKECFIE